MIINFTLTMNNLVIDCQLIDQVILEWTESMPEARLLAISARWLHSDKFLTQRMNGLCRVGESSLTIQT